MLIVLVKNTQNFQIPAFIQCIHHFEAVIMCEQTEIHYLEGDVVWVKLGACWWPGQVCDVEKLPHDILESFRKKPIAAVQFFNEDKYEYVKNLDQICRYNCRRKNEFIKKGLDMYRAKQREGSSFMDKFSKDVSMAEHLTGGNPDIVTDNTFAPEEKPSYRGIFGSEKKPEKKGKTSSSSPVKGSPSWRSKLSSPSTPQTPLSSPRRPITHPRIIRMLKGEEEQHDVRIRQQPVTPQRATSPPNEPYKCYKCDFTSKRLNVVILHSKSHSGEGATNGQEAKHVHSKSPNVATPHRGRGRPRGSYSSKSAKNSPKTVSLSSSNPVEATTPKKTTVLNSEDSTPKETVPSPEKKSPKTPSIGKRKSYKAIGEKGNKKKKSSEDFREKLLAEWEDEDQEEEEKEIMILKQELSKSESLSSPPPPSEQSTEKMNYSTNKVATSSNTNKPKEMSCFDFDEKADSMLDHELEERAKKFAEARKFPRRLEERMEVERKTENVAASSDIQKTKEDVSVKSVLKIEAVGDNKDLNSEFEHLMAQTELPSLPEVPSIKMQMSESDAALDDVPIDQKQTDEHQDVKSDNVLLPNEEVSSDTILQTQTPELTDLPQNSLVEAGSEISDDMNGIQSVPQNTSDKKQIGITTDPLLNEPEPVLAQPEQSSGDLTSLELASESSVKVESSFNEAPSEQVSQTTLETPKHSVVSTMDEESQLNSVLQEQQNTIVEEHCPTLPLQAHSEVPMEQEPVSIADARFNECSPQEVMHTSVIQEPIQTNIARESVQVSDTLIQSQMSVSQDSIQIPLEDMELDINSMPVVMGDTLLTDDTTTKLAMNTVSSSNSLAITVPPAISEKPVQTLMRVASISEPGSTTKVVKPDTRNINVASSLDLVTEASTSVVKSSAQTTTSNTTPKILKQVVKSVKIQPGTSGALRASDGTIIAPKGTAGTSRYVLIQHPSGKQTIYATSGNKSGQQCVTMKAGATQGLSTQQTVGKKLVIVKSPQGGAVTQEVLSSLQQGLSSGGKIVPQRILTSQGTILKQVGRPTQKVMHVTPQQMKALTGGKGGAKLTMQSTPTKVVLPTVQKMGSQAQGMKVITSASSVKSKPNTILIQTTQGTGVASAIVSRAVTGNASVVTTSVHTKLAAIPQTVVRQISAAPRSKIVATASPSGSSMQRVVVSAPARSTVLQTQQKVVAARSVTQPRVLMQKGRGTSTVRVPNVGAIAGMQSQVTQVQQVKKVPGQRTQVLQKGKQGQVVQKIVAVQQPAAATVTKPSSSTESVQTVTLPSMQTLPEATAPLAQSAVAQSNTLVLSTAPTVISQNLVTTQSATLPVATSAPLLSHEHIAQVITPTGTEQLGEGGTATYVLVAIDDQGTIQPYDSSGLVSSYDGSNQNSETNTRTLYIDPASLGASGDLENIFLAINNSASGGTGTLLNIGQANTVSGASISTPPPQTVFNIADSHQAAPAASQDILAAALANTDVFQSDSTLNDSLTVVNSSQSASGPVMTSRLLESPSLIPSSSTTSIHQATVLLPSLSPSPMPPSNPAGVLETSLTLNQPIMTPLEVPSSVTNLQQPPPPPPPVPSSLEIPLTITQPVLSMPAVASPYSNLTHQESMQSTEAEMLDSPISSSSVSQVTSRPVITSKSTLQPSMPLLSEDVSDSQTINTETSIGSELMEDQPGSSLNSVQTSNPDHILSSDTSNPAEQNTLPSYAQVPEVSSHVTEEQITTNNDMDYDSNLRNQQLSDQDLSTSYHEIPESSSEARASDIKDALDVHETQSGSEQTVSTSFSRNMQLPVPNKEKPEAIDSSNPPVVEPAGPNYSVENSSEAIAVKDMTSVHDSSPHDATSVLYEQVESTSQLRGGHGGSLQESVQTLSSDSNSLHPYPPAPESTSNVPEEVLQSNSSLSFSIPSYSQIPESTCELQEEKRIGPIESASGSCYSQVPESTSHMPEVGVIRDSPVDILDSSQHSVDSNVLTPYQVPESSSEASVVSYEDTHGSSSVTPPTSNQTSYTSCSQLPESTSQIHDVLSFSDSSTEVSGCSVPLAQSMPILLESGPEAIGTKRHFDAEGTDSANDLDHSKRVKIDESEK